MSNPCRLDDTEQNKIAYAIGYEKGRTEAIEEYEKALKLNFMRMIGEHTIGEILDKTYEQLKGEQNE